MPVHARKDYKRFEDCLENKRKSLDSRKDNFHDAKRHLLHCKRWRFSV